MKGKVLTFAILSALSAGAMAGGYGNGTQGQIGPNTRVPDGAAVVATPLLPEQPVTEPSASAGASTAPAPVYAAPAPAYATPANPPIATTTTANGSIVTNQPVVDANGNVIGSAAVVQPSPVWVTQGVAQSGPGATDKTRPGYPDDNTGHSAWDVGTSSAGS